MVDSPDVLYGKIAADVYQRLIDGEEVAIAEISNPAYNMVRDMMDDKGEHALRIYNKGNNLFYSLRESNPVSGGTPVIQKPDDLAPTPVHEAKTQVEIEEHQNKLAKDVLKRVITDKTPMPSAEEIDALKYYSLLGRKNLVDVRRFLNSYVEANEGNLSDADVTEDRLIERRAYYMDKLHSWNDDEVAQDRAEGGNTVQRKSTEELCSDFVNNSLTRGHQIAALITDAGDSSYIDSIRRKYPHAFENIDNLRRYGAEGEVRSPEEMAQGTATLNTLTTGLWCKP